MMADLPTPSARKRVFGAGLGMLEVLRGSEERALGGTLMMAGPDGTSPSAAEAGARHEASVSASADADSALIRKVRSGVRLPLQAMVFVLLVMGVLPVTLRRR